MSTAPTIDLSYFPGCSLATTAKESNQALIECCDTMGIRLIEVPDWNCCGSSSAHSIDHDLAIDLASRNLALAPAGRPLVAACPSCTRHSAKQAQHRLKTDEGARRRYEKLWGRALRTPTSRVRHFFGPLAENRPGTPRSAERPRRPRPLLRPSDYGCMLNRPYELRATSEQHGIMERILQGCGHAAAALGPRLAVLRYLSNRIQARHRHPHGVRHHEGGGRKRCGLHRDRLRHVPHEPGGPLHGPGSRSPFSTSPKPLALAHGTHGHRDWFSRHLIDPRPLLVRKGLYPKGK